MAESNEKKKQMGSQMENPFCLEDLYCPAIVYRCNVQMVVNIFKKSASARIL